MKPIALQVMLSMILISFGLFTAAQNCIPSCPSNIITKADSGKGGTIVHYPSITTDTCGTVTYTPASGSYFRIGSTSVIATTPAGQKCSFTVIVTDNEAPVLSPIILSPQRIWPANGKMKEVALHYTYSDNAEESTCTVSVSSNDSNENNNSYELVNPHLVRLKASRLPNGQARIYTITVTCTDLAGNTTRRTTNIAVGRQAASVTTATGQ